MNNEIKEILKVDNKLLEKIENILGSELTNEEYDEFYKYFNEIRKPNILIDIKDVEPVKKCVEELQQRINEAVEYIETNIEDEYKWDGLLYENKEKKKLLDILKGDDTNE